MIPSKPSQSILLPSSHTCKQWWSAGLKHLKDVSLLSKSNSNGRQKWKDMKCYQWHITAKPLIITFIMLHTYSSTSPKFQIISVCFCSSKQPVTYCQRLNMIKPAERLETISLKHKQYSSPWQASKKLCSLIRHPHHHQITTQASLQANISFVIPIWDQAISEQHNDNKTVYRGLRVWPDSLFLTLCSMINMQANGRIERGICLWFH